MSQNAEKISVETITIPSKQLPVEVRFVCSVLGLYASFLYWGYLQEKLTSTDYPKFTADGLSDGVMQWDFSLGLNFLMAVAAALGAFLLELLSGSYRSASFSLFFTMALSSSIASPLGYFSLKFIPYPLMVLAKSSKQVPVMLMGLLIFNQKYPWYKYVSVVLVCGGVALYTLSKPSKNTASSNDSHLSSHNSYPFSSLTGNWRLCFGILLILGNLTLDGYTNNKQDQVFVQQKISSLAMMKYLNIWQAIILIATLFLMHLFQVNGTKSELYMSIEMLQLCPSVRYDILLFCISATIGQVLIFVVMQEFGSLVWITVGVTRKLLTIVISIFLFKHSVSTVQWSGILSVFIGLGLESYMSYKNKNKGPSVKTVSKGSITIEGDTKQQQEPKSVVDSVDAHHAPSLSESNNSLRKRAIVSRTTGAP